VSFVTKEVMPAGYDVVTGIAVAIVVFAMLAGSFGQSHP
jgi:hypothetical protein